MFIMCLFSDCCPFMFCLFSGCVLFVVCLCSVCFMFVLQIVFRECSECCTHVNSTHYEPSPTIQYKTTSSRHPRTSGAMSASLRHLKPQGTGYVENQEFFLPGIAGLHLVVVTSCKRVLIAYEFASVVTISIRDDLALKMS